jgi:hypothetical protein
MTCDRLGAGVFPGESSPQACPDLARRSPTELGVPLRTRLIRTFLGTMIAILALLSVGLTAPADGPFTIDLRPAFFSLDPQSIAESRAHAIGLDVDVKFGSLHLHYKWTAIPLAPPTTKTPGTLL